MRERRKGFEKGGVEKYVGGVGVDFKSRVKVKIER